MLKKPNLKLISEGNWLHRILENENYIYTREFELKEIKTTNA